MTGPTGGHPGASPPTAPVGSHRIDRPRSDDRLGEDPPTLAADLFLIMLDDASGRLRVHPRAAGYALAGALLVELWLTRRLAVADCRITPTLDRPLPADELLRTTLGWLLTDPAQTAAGQWVEALAATALDRVGDQLTAAGWVRRAERRRLGERRRPGGDARFEPVDRTRVYWRAGRLVTALATAPTWPDVLLFALVDAAGFTPGLLANSATPPAREFLQAAVTTAWRTYPQVAELVRVVRVLVDRVAVAPRR